MSNTDDKNRIVNSTGKTKAGDKDDKKISRRDFLRKSFMSAVTGGLLVGGYGFIESKNVSFDRRKLPVPFLPDNWVGKKAVQVSDIHCSPLVGRKYLAKTFERINREKPDLLFFTGDYVSKDPNYVKILAEEASKLKTSMGDEGKIAVLGNHDRWTDAGLVMEQLKKVGFTFLNNDKKLIDPENSFYILGVDDLWTGKLDIEKTIGSLDPEREPTIMLSHNPDLFSLAASFGVRVMLSGHTHGGQVRLPFFGAPILPSTFGYEQGFYRIDKSLLYVNRGLGLIAPPVRFLCPPEVTVYTLVKKDE